MISAYKHGRHAAQHAKHIQACPFDTDTHRMARMAQRILRRVGHVIPSNREVIHAEHY